MKHIFTVILFYCLIQPVLFSQNKLTPEQWKEDLNYFQKEMVNVHINPYHETSKETFDAFVENLSAKIPGMTDNQVIAEITRMTAMIGDGHTALNIFGYHDQVVNNKKVINFHFFPL